MTVAGIDFSSKAVDIVLLDEDTDAATWHRFELSGQDAFDRTRSVRPVLPFYTSEFWDDILAVGIEQPRGNHGTVHMARVQGAILACIPRRLLVQPWNPAEWRTAVGLSGNASKAIIEEHVKMAIGAALLQGWPQDACDAYCIALATRQLITLETAA